jgi:energy-coupling factor transporter ATP-binding protein EcfA2
MITQFSVKNYKGLKDVSIPLTPIHVVIGQNDSGKTSLLEAIHAFCSSTSEGIPLVKAFSGKWRGKELVSLGAESSEIELSADVEGVRHDQKIRLHYEIGVDFPSQNNPACKLIYERIEENDGGMEKIPRMNPVQTTISFRANAPPQSRGQLDRIAETIGSSSFYSLDARIMAIPAAINESRKFRMDPDGFGLSTLLDDLLDYEPERFISLRDRFCGFFPQFRRIRLETEIAASRTYEESGIHQTGRGNGKGIYFETQDGSTIRAQQASDGAILFLGFLTLSYLPSPPKVLLIEEPEKGVYPKRLAEIVEILKKMTASTDKNKTPQIIMTTHSPYLLTSFVPEEVTVMSRRNGSLIARPLRDAPNIQERLGNGEFYLGELWYNLDEEELFQDARPQPSA